MSDFLPIALIIILLFGIMFGGFKWKYYSLDHKMELNIASFDSFVANGKKFKTEDIESFDINPHGYSNDIYTFVMKDGTVIETQEGSLIWYKETSQN